MTCHVELVAEPRWDDRATISRALDGLYDAEVGRPSGWKPLCALVRDGDSVQGGLWGTTYWGWLQAEMLFVPEALRGQGFGGRLLALAEEEAVVLLDGATEELERHGQQDDADARAGHHARRGDLPRRGDEARVDRVPVPQHLFVRRFLVSLWPAPSEPSSSWQGRRTEILQPPPMSMAAADVAAAAAPPVVVGIDISIVAVGLC